MKDIFEPATGIPSSAIESAVKLYGLLNDELNPVAQLKFCRYFQAASNKRSRRQLLETELLFARSDNEKLEREMANVKDQLGHKEKELLEAMLMISIGLTLELVEACKKLKAKDAQVEDFKKLLLEEQNKNNRKKGCQGKLQWPNTEVSITQLGIVIRCKLRNKGRYVKKLPGSLARDNVMIKSMESYGSAHLFWGIALVSPRLGTQNQKISVSNFSMLEVKSLQCHAVDEDAFTEALPEFLSPTEPGIPNMDMIQGSMMLDSDEHVELEDAEGVFHEKDTSQGKGLCDEVFYEVQGGEFSDSVSVVFLTRSSSSYVYNGINTQMSIHMSKLEFFCSRPTVVALIGFGFDLYWFRFGDNSVQQPVSTLGMFCLLLQQYQIKHKWRYKLLQMNEGHEIATVLGSRTMLVLIQWYLTSLRASWVSKRGVLIGSGVEANRAG